MGKPQPIWVDVGRTRTAADVQDLAECDGLMRRFHREIDDLLAQGADHPEAPRNIKQALFYRRQGLRALERRRADFNSN